MNFNSFEPKDGDFASLVDKKGKSDFSASAKKIESTNIEHKDHSATFNTNNSLKKATSAKDFPKRNTQRTILTNTDEYRKKAQDTYIENSKKANDIDIPDVKNYNTVAASYEDVEVLDAPEALTDRKGNSNTSKIGSDSLAKSDSAKTKNNSQRKQSSFITFIIMVVIWVFLYTLIGNSGDEESNIALAVIIVCAILGLILSKFTKKK